MRNVTLTVYKYMSHTVNNLFKHGHICWHIALSNLTVSVEFNFSEQYRMIQSIFVLPLKIKKESELSILLNRRCIIYWRINRSICINIKTVKPE